MKVYRLCKDGLMEGGGKEVTTLHICPSIIYLIQCSAYSQDKNDRCFVRAIKSVHNTHVAIKRCFTVKNDCAKFHVNALHCFGVIRVAF